MALLYGMPTIQYYRLEALAYLYVSSNTMSPALSEAYLRTKWHFDPSSHLATIDTSRNSGGCCAP